MPGLPGADSVGDDPTPTVSSAHGSRGHGLNHAYVTLAVELRFFPLFTDASTVKVQTSYIGTLWQKVPSVRTSVLQYQQDTTIHHVIHIICALAFHYAFT